MEIYILKSGICLAIFYGFYKLVLEKESFHVFKRFYLLVSVVLAFVIPLITFTEYIEVVPQEVPLSFPESSITHTVIEAEPINYMTIILWSIYGFGVLLFSFKFLKNLSGIIFRIKRNPKFKNQSFIHVLLQDLVIPHTFLSYIFLNKHKFETHQIPKEVLLHEETHAKQKHSLDVLFIEILHIFFWFNPFIYFIKRSIKLNHEFLADQAVINNGVTPSTYQQILLAFSSNASEPQLANAINYSSIKKRFTVMKTHTSKQAFWLRSFILLPLLAILIYSFSEKKVVENESQNQQKEFLKKISIISISDDNETIIMDKIKYSLDDFEKHIVELADGLSTEEKEKISPIIVWNSPNGKAISKTKEKTLVKLKTILSKHSLWEDSNKKTPLLFIISDNETIKVNNKIYSLDNLEKYIVELVKNLSKEEKAKITPLIVYNSPEGNKTFEKVNNILRKYNLLKVNKNVNPDISVHTTNNSNQQKTTPEEIKEYNTLIKKINSLEEGERIIRVKDKNRIEYIYNLMTAEQKKENESFPDFLTVAPPPQPYQQKAKNGNDIYIAINEKGILIVNKNIVQIRDLKGFLNDLTKDLTKEEKEKIAVNLVSYEAPDEVLTRVKSILRESVFLKINITKSQEKVIEMPMNSQKQNFHRKVIDDYLKEHPESMTKVKSESGETIEIVEIPTELMPPPPPPPAPILPQYPSKELLEAKIKYDEKGNAYGEAMRVYFKEKKGTLPELRKMYDNTMVLYKEFSDLAKKETKASKN